MKLFIVVIICLCLASEAFAALPPQAPTPLQAPSKVVSKNNCGCGFMLPCTCVNGCFCEDCACGVNCPGLSVSLKHSPNPDSYKSIEANGKDTQATKTTLSEAQQPQAPPIKAETGLWEEWQNGWYKSRKDGSWFHNNFGTHPAEYWDDKGNCTSNSNGACSSTLSTPLLTGPSYYGYPPNMGGYPIYSSPYQMNGYGQSFQFYGSKMKSFGGGGMRMGGGGCAGGR